MPYTIRKMPGQNCYRVAKVVPASLSQPGLGLRKTSSRPRPATKTTHREVLAKCTTRAKAESQVRLLNALKYNKDFVPRGRASQANARGGSIRRTKKNRK